ncbi:hypothetical protein AAVH_28777 [Aphelenchoides avenae]|nr:hypothetical protein AAVH_28777 [Aphelenchus avenae]
MSACNVHLTLSVFLLAMPVLAYEELFTSVEGNSTFRQEPRSRWLHRIRRCAGRGWCSCGQDYTLPKPCDPNHGTSWDPKRIICDASLKGKMCQICPDHIVCLGGADSNVPVRVRSTCCNKPGCTDRFIASEGCPAKR